MNDSRGGGRPKKKRSFLQKAKKFGRQGQRGKGTNIAQDQYDYLVRVLERWRDPFEQDDEKQMFVSNVFGQMEGDERNFAGNQLASRVIELLIPHADARVQLNLCQALSQDLRIICTDQFASHVMEKLLILSSFSPQEEEGREGRLGWVRKVCRYLVNNFDEFSTNTYASHLLRTGVQCLTGCRVLDKDKTGQTEGFDTMDQYQFKDDPELKECLEILEEKIVGVEAEVVEDELTSSTIQTILKCYHKSEQSEGLKKMLKFLLDKLFYSSLYFLDSQANVRLLETVIECSAKSEKIFSKIHKKIFSGNLALISKHPTGNFVVQRFFENIPNSELFSSCWTEVSASLEDILGGGFTGVVLSIVKAAVKLKCEQSAVLQQLGTALHCGEELEQLAPACIKLMIVENLNDDLPIHLHGSLILQQLLLLNKPIKVIRSLLLMEGSQLRKVFSDPRGSHIMDKFIKSPTVGEKSRDALVRRLSGEFVSLACSKHGSKAFENLWNAASAKTKQNIVEELSKQDTVLQSHQFGKYIHKSCAVSVWKYQKDDWNQHISKADKEREMFKDILEDAPKKRKGDWSLGKSPKLPKVEVKAEPEEEVKPKEEVKPEPEVKPEEVKEKKKKKKKQSYLDDL